MNYLSLVTSKHAINLFDFIQNSKLIYCYDVTKETKVSSKFLLMKILPSSKIHFKRYQNFPESFCSSNQKTSQFSVLVNDFQLFCDYIYFFSFLYPCVCGWQFLLKNALFSGYSIDHDARRLLSKISGKFRINRFDTEGDPY